MADRARKDQPAPPPPTYCKCGHIRIKHPGGLRCTDRNCIGCTEFVAAKKQPEHTPQGRS